MHTILADALDVVPNGVNVIILSRHQPPSQYARLRANKKLTLLGWDDIRFSFEESRDLISGKHSGGYLLNAYAVINLLQERYLQDKAEEISHLLTQGHWTHDYPITYANAREIGLPVSSDMPEMVYQLMALYPQPVRRSLGVEYIPEPRSEPGGKKGQ